MVTRLKNYIDFEKITSRDTAKLPSCDEFSNDIQIVTSVLYNEISVHPENNSLLGA